MKYIDIHCHLNLSDYDSDIQDVIKRASTEDIGMIIVGVDIETSEKAIEIANKNKNIWATIAIHPDNVNSDFDFSKIEELSKNDKVVGIGECGLDYFNSDESDWIRQEEIFIKHIMLANSLNKPLMLHVRNGKDNKNAYRRSLEILKKYSKVKANFHFFAGNMDDLKMILDMDYSVSFTGVLTFTRDYDELVKYTPLDHIMSETDAPYVSPIPYRGKRNEPLYVKEIVKAISNIKGESLEKVSSQIIDNASRMFSI